MESINVDIAVIGAGFAGLACARKLVKAGHSVVVLEARNRVGGRCVNQPLPPPNAHLSVEGGGQFIGPAQTRMYELAKEFGVEHFAASQTGKSVDYCKGRLAKYSGPIPPGGLLGAIELGMWTKWLDCLAKSVPLATPWTARRASDWDAMTLQDWVDRNVRTARAKSLMHLAVLSVYSVEPRELSFLYFLQSVHSAGSINKLIEGAQKHRIKGGPQAIIDALAVSLGSAVRLNACVDRVSQSAHAVSVSSAGLTVDAKAVVVAMSPAVAANIRFDPLDEAMSQRQQLMQSVPMGAIWKVQAVYARPFWREAGLDGKATSDSFLPKITFDNTPPDPRAPGVMSALIDGQDARDAVLMSPADRKAAVLKAFAEYFGPKALAPIGYLEMNWQAEPYSLGGPAGVFPKGVLTRYRRALSDPVGRVYWAGTETSEIWSGYMEGAVHSGERAAEQVLKVL